MYEEEIYGRGENRAYWWSPDSTRLAFLRIDDTPVPTYAVVDHIPYEQNVEQWDYPKAGDPNPLVKLGVARVAGGPAELDRHLEISGGGSPDRAGRLDARQPEGRLRRAEPHADVARPEPGGSRIRRHADDPSGNEQVLDQRGRRGSCRPG